MTSGERQRHGGGPLEPHAAAAAGAGRALADQLDAAPHRAPPTSFISESTLPRMTPSLASMRWMVGSDRPDSSASSRWSMPSSARAARSCAAVIMSQTSL